MLSLVCCYKILLCLLLGNSSVFSNGQSAMSLIIINLNSFFRAVGITKFKFLDFNITLMQDESEQIFCSSFAT